MSTNAASTRARVSSSFHTAPPHTFHWGMCRRMPPPKYFFSWGSGLVSNAASTRARTSASCGGATQRRRGKVKRGRTTTNLHPSDDIKISRPEPGRYSGRATRDAPAHPRNCDSPCTTRRRAPETASLLPDRRDRRPGNRPRQRSAVFVDVS